MAPPPWSSQLAGDARRDREELLVAFVELAHELRAAEPAAFAGGEQELAAAVERTAADYVVLVAAGAEVMRLESALETADRRATQREAEDIAVILQRMLELVTDLQARIPT
jgi:alpha-D-ribose 1-methylphosphonate 5-triphosphate synthase subunit PhnL